MNQFKSHKISIHSGYEDQDIREFENNVRAFLGDEDPIEYLVGPSIEGIGIGLVYEKGGLSLAFTERDGSRAEYVTANVKTLLTVPLTLVQLDQDCAIPDLLTVRGDVYMESDAFEILNQGRIERDLSPFASPMDATSDSLIQPNPRITAKRSLNMFCSGIDEYKGPSFETRMESLVMLQKWGLRVNRPFFKVYLSIDEVIRYCHHIEEIREQFPFTIDGAVIEMNRLLDQEKLIQKGGGPGWAFVFKFKP